MKRLVFSTVEYTVEDGDTVEKVAARFDCTPSQLTKLNKLKSRILFIGQKISVPDGTTIEEVIEERPRRLSEMVESSEICVTPVDERRRASETSAIEKTTATVPPPGDDDAECVLKFFKVHTERYLLDGSRAPGVFIVTPNCAMFDPDLEQDEKFDEIQEKFGVVAPLDDVFSISLFETKLDKATRNKIRVAAIIKERRSSESPRKTSINVDVSERRPTSTSISLDLNIQSEKRQDTPLTRLLPFYSVDHTANMETISEGTSGDGEEHQAVRSMSMIRDPLKSLSPQVIRRRFSTGFQKLRKTWRSGEYSDSGEEKTLQAYSLLIVFDFLCIAVGLMSIWAEQHRENKPGSFSYGDARWDVVGIFASTVLVILGSLFVSKECAERLLHLETENEPAGGIWLLIGATGVFLAHCIFYNAHSFHNFSLNVVLNGSSSSWLQEHCADVSHVLCRFIPGLSRLLLPRVNPLSFLNFCGWILTSFNYVLLESGRSYTCDSFIGFTLVLMLIGTMKPLAIYTGHILLQTSPTHTLPQLDKSLREAATLDGVLEISEDHFWQLSLNKMAGSVVVRVRRDADEQLVLSQLTGKLYPIVSELTVQINKDTSWKPMLLN